jgi:hypothetical protein
MNKVSFYTDKITCMKTKYIGETQREKEREQQSMRERERDRDRDRDSPMTLSTTGKMVSLILLH